jgi:hypothetical protein
MAIAPPAYCADIIYIATVVVATKYFSFSGRMGKKNAPLSVARFLAKGLSGPRTAADGYSITSQSVIG